VVEFEFSEAKGVALKLGLKAETTLPPFRAVVRSHQALMQGDGIKIYVAHMMDEKCTHSFVRNIGDAYTTYQS
jgi:hypothetical protein